MPQPDGLNRRMFLRNAGMTALAGAAGSHASFAASPAGRFAPPPGKYDFDTPYSRIGTDSNKWDQQIRTFGIPDLVAGMGIADMDFRCAPEITKALADRVQHEVWGYLDMPKAFVDGIVAWNKRRYGVDVNPESVALSNGVHPGLIAAIRTFCPPGSKVLLFTPAYDGFYSDFRFTGTKPEECLMKVVDGRYRIDFDDFERRISHETNAFVLCNPHNPTGNCWSADDLMRLGEICLRRRVVVLVDEIHCDFVTKGVKYTPFASLPNKAVVNNSLTFKAASKSFGLSAMKVAWFHSDNMDLVARVKANNHPDLATLGIVANQAAYAKGEAWLNECVEYVDGNHDFAQKFIRANMSLVDPGAKPQGTYLAWIDVSKAIDKIGAKQAAADAARENSGRGPTAEAVLRDWLAKHARVVLNPGTNYGLGGANHMRVNLATSRRTLEAALTSMAKALDGLKTSTSAV